MKRKSQQREKTWCLQIHSRESSPLFSPRHHGRPKKGEGRSTTELMTPTRKTQHAAEAALTPLPAATTSERMLNNFHEQTGRTN
jgi:hypothetical protein